MKQSVTLLSFFFCLNFLTLGCANSNEIGSDDAVASSMDSPVYKLMLSLSDQHQVGHWRNGEADLSLITLPFSFQWEAVEYEVFKAKTLGGLEPAESHNLYLSLALLNKSTGDTILFATALELDDFNKPEHSPRPECVNYQHLCWPSKGAPKGFQTDARGCIIGCECGRSPCDHKLSTGNLKGTDLISEISRSLIANSGSN